jgi:MFS family permease
MATTAIRRVPFYGWIVVSSLSLTQVVSWGIVYYSFSLFLTPMTREFDWSQTRVAGAFSVALLISGLAALPIGRFIDRHGARGVLLTGSCLAALLLIAWSRVQTLTAFYAIWLGMGLAMAAVLYEPAFAIVVAWFTRQRALALTILTSVGGLASTIFVPATAALVAAMGWRTTLLYLAGLLAIVNIPLYALVVRSRPADLGMRPDVTGDDAAGVAPETRAASAIAPIGLSPRAAWLVAIMFGFSSLSSATAFVHVFPFLVERGYSTRAAAFAVAAIGAAQVPARLAFALVVRVLPAGWIASSIFVMQALGLVCLGFVMHASLLLLPFAFLFGFANGLMTLIRPLLVAERFDLAQYGSISGTIAFCGQLARAGGPILGAWVATTWRYEIVWCLLAALLCLGAAGMRLLERLPAHPHQ